MKTVAQKKSELLEEIRIEETLLAYYISLCEFKALPCSAAFASRYQLLDKDAVARLLDADPKDATLVSSYQTAARCHRQTVRDFDRAEELMKACKERVDSARKQIQTLDQTHTTTKRLVPEAVEKQLGEGQ